MHQIEQDAALIIGEMVALAGIKYKQRFLILRFASKLITETKHLEGTLSG